MAVLIGLSAHVATADITIAENTVSARPGEASVLLGSSVRIPLIAVRPNVSDNVSFRITVQPKFGILGEIESDFSDTGRAWVVYTPKPDAVASVDSFKFNAKLEGKAAAPSVAIKVTLESAEADIRVQPALVFGKVEIGKPATRQLKIKNVGTALFTTMLRPPAPWSIPEDQRQLVIEPGKSVVIDVGFTPVDLERSKFLLSLQAENDEGNVEFSGIGRSPFGRPFGTLDLTFDKASGLRRGLLRLENRTERELPLKLEATEPFRVERLVVLDPGQAVEVPVSAGGIEASRGKLTISSHFHKEVVPLAAKPTPAKIEVLEPQDRRFDFVLLDTDAPPVHEVVVVNRGGEKAFIYGETSRPFKMVEGGDPTELGPGKKMTMKVTLSRNDVGTFDRLLTILGTANRIQFQLSAKVTRNLNREAAGVSLPDLPPLVDAADQEFFSALPDVKSRLWGTSDKKRVIKAEIPTVEQVYLEAQTKRTLVFSWDHPGSPDHNYLLEVEVYDKGAEDAFPRAVWYAATDNVKVEKDEKGARMTLSKMQPGRSFRMRILTMNNVGHCSEPTRPKLVFTLPPSNKKRWLLLPLFAVISGGGFYVWRRRQQV